VTPLERKDSFILIIEKCGYQVSWFDQKASGGVSGFDQKASGGTDSVKETRTLRTPREDRENREGICIHNTDHLISTLAHPIQSREQS